MQVTRFTAGGKPPTPPPTIQSPPSGEPATVDFAKAVRTRLLAGMTMPQAVADVQRAQYQLWQQGFAGVDTLQALLSILK